jgi:glycine betaine transporter
MFRQPLLLVALAATSLIAAAGLIDPEAMGRWAGRVATEQFTSRGWFIMLLVSTLLLTVIGLALSPFGRIRLGADDDRPEFGTVTWLAMLFATGMGVGLLYYGAAEPITHFNLFRQYGSDADAASAALMATYFNWGMHAWAIYATVALVMAYFTFRRGGAMILSAPVEGVFGRTGWPRYVGFAIDLLTIVAIAIGLAGTLAMGVFQVQAGVARVLGLADTSLLTLPVFLLLCIASLIPLTFDVTRGMSIMSNVAMVICGGLLVWLILAGSTHYVMNALVEGFGRYVASVVPMGFTAFTFVDEALTDWFQTWPLNYMIWWLAWAPFVSVFIARISRGRTIREFLLGVVAVPGAFSVIWFGTFGALGFSEILRGNDRLLAVTLEDFDSVTFVMLESLPFGLFTSAAVVVACFIFVVTSVVTAAFTLAIFSARGNVDPPTSMKLIWGVILAVLGFVMILSGDVGVVRSIIAVFAIAFLFIVPLLLVCLGKALAAERAR